MALNNKPYLTILMLIIVTHFFSCKESSVDLPNVENCENYYYEDCNTIEPVEGSVRLNFSINKQIHMVVFDVYKGYVDEGNLFFSDTSWNSNIEYIMPINQYYSVKATYLINGISLKVIDGGELKNYSKQVCDSTCWAADELTLDLSIHQ
jgi:hypothetical protein